MVKWLFALFCFIAMPAHAVEIVAQFDRDPVALGDPVVLRFTADGVISSEPDFSPLQQDFEIRGRSQSNSFMMNNGVSSVRTVWELTLFPRKVGTLVVPPIRFGTDQSQSLSLQVLDQPVASAASSPDQEILVELEVETKTPYVQQQTLIIQRLLHLATLQPQASLTHPAVEAGKGTIQQLGDAKNTTLMRNGRNYQVIERRYALYPQQSGELVLGRTVFEGSLADPRGRGFDPFGFSGQRVQRFSQPVTLQVQAQPSSYTGQYWLPAKSLSLNAHWQTPPDKLKAGEPTTLTLAIVADGLTAEQLPKLELHPPATVKAYTDQPELHNETSDKGIIGIRQEKWVFVAPYSGTYTLPAITLVWWDSAAGKQQLAQTKAFTLQVSGGAAAPAGLAPTTNAAVIPATPAEPESQTVPSAGASSGWLWWYWALGLAVVCLIGSGVWLLLRQRQPKPTIDTSPEKMKHQPHKPDIAAALQAVESACKSNAPRAAYDAVHHWLGVAGLRGQPLSPALQQALRQLDVVLFGRDSQTWQGKALWEAVREFKPETKTTAKPSALAELYPDG